MSVYYVFQGITYELEFKGGYVWSPQLDKIGHKNAGYTLMTKIKTGDFILHNVNGKMLAISKAKTDCYEAQQPKELIEADKDIDWDNEGYRIDVDYFEFDEPLIMSNYRDWLKVHYVEGSAFSRLGRGKQQYMCNLDKEQGIFLIKNAIPLQTSYALISVLNDALQVLSKEGEDGYNSVEPKKVPVMVKENVRKMDKTLKQVKIDTDSKVREEALKKADYKCEYNSLDRTFVGKNGKKFTKSHYLIPVSQYKDFEKNLECKENIVSLCSYCYDLLHYGQYEEKIPILSKLYRKRKATLKSLGINITFEQLKSYYK